MMKSSLWLSTLVCIWSLSLSRLIQLPPIRLDKRIQIRVGEFLAIDEPAIKLQNVDKRQIFTVVNGSVLPMTDICKTSQPQIQYQLLDEVKHQDVKSLNTVPSYLITNLADLHKVQYQYDTMIVNDTTVYTASSGGLISKTVIQNDVLIGKFSSVLPVQDTGYLVQVGNNILFLGFKTAVDVTNFPFIPVSGWEPEVTFNSAVGFTDQAGSNYIVASNGRKGATIYSYVYQRATLSVSNVMSDASGREFNVMDVAVLPKNNTIYFMDAALGVLSMNYGAKFAITKTQLIFSESNCQLFDLNQQTNMMVASCRSLYQFNLGQWPLKVENLGATHIKVRAINQVNELIVLTGSSVYKMYYEGELVHDYSDELVHKFLFLNGSHQAIIVNEEGVKLVGYGLTETHIYCRCTNASLAGIRQVLLKTTAECNPEFPSIKSGSLNVSLSDTCVYNQYAYMNIWEPGHVNTSLFIIVLSVITGLVLLMTFWWCFLKKRLSNYRSELSGFSKIGSSVNHVQLVEEKVETNDNDVQGQQVAC